jgi:hypothetical protein
MSVRRAVETDRFRVVALLRDSHQAARFAWPFQAAYADRLFRDHMAAGLVLVLGEPAQGLLMAKTFDHPFGAGRWAKETVWYIAPRVRGRSALQMLDAYETWAREQRCDVVGMASLATNDVSALYLRRGYVPAEMHFIKALT